MVSLDTDILFLDEADIVVGEGDLVQMQAAEEESHEDEEKADSPFLHNTHQSPICANQCTGFLSLESSNLGLDSIQCSGAAVGCEFIVLASPAMATCVHGAPFELVPYRGAFFSLVDTTM